MSASNPRTSASLFGDIKLGLQTTDHAGWCRLDGRLLAALTPSQQAAAAVLGLAGSLPNYADRSPVGSSGSKPLLSSGGAATTLLAQNNLPNVQLGGSTDAQGAHTHPVTVTFHDATGGGFNGGKIQSTDRVPVRTQANASEVAIQSAGSHSHGITTASINGGVAQQTLSVQNPYASVNFFVYLGA